MMKKNNDFDIETADTAEIMNTGAVFASAVRMPAEWERCRAVMVAWPHADTDWAYMLPQVEACYDELVAAIARFARPLIVTPHPDYVCDRLERRGLSRQDFTVAEIQTNDTWTRDYGPVSTVSADGTIVINDFCFNGWGMKFAADRDNLVTRRLHFEEYLSGVYRNRLGFVLEGGSIESDGHGTVLTTLHCLMSPNRNGQMTRRQIQHYLKDALGARRVLWLEHGALEGDDTDGHIDTLARLAPGNTIIYVGCPNPADSHYDELTAMRNDLIAMRDAEGNPYNLIELPMPAPVYDEDGMRLPATYANYLIVNDGILMPTYGQPKNDLLAQQILMAAFPDRTVVPVDCRALICQHGSLHCATMQLY